MAHLYMWLRGGAWETAHQLSGVPKQNSAEPSLTLAGGTQEDTGHTGGYSLPGPVVVSPRTFPF